MSRDDNTDNKKPYFKNVFLNADWHHLNDEYEGDPPVMKYSEKENGIHMLIIGTSEYVYSDKKIMENDYRMLKASIPHLFEEKIES